MTARVHTEENCGYCGRFIGHAWRSRHCWFAGHDLAFCPRPGCVDRADTDRDATTARLARRRRDRFTASGTAAWEVL